MYKIVPLAHLSLEIEDNISVKIIGDEESQLSLVSSNNIDDLENESAEILENNNTTIEYPKYEKMFFKLIAE